MAYRHLVAPRDALGKVGQIIQIEVVAAVKTQTHAARRLGSLHVWGDGSLAVGAVACGVGLSI